MKQAFDRILKEQNWTASRMPRILDNIYHRLSRSLPEGASPSLTVFQRKVIEHPDFWRDWSNDESSQNLMVQGATSAGKTLVSELAVLDTLNHHKKAVILVPLKAMVHERTRHFREDMGHGLPDYDIAVYGSSSDYMENDELIINGEHDVAIIVYEKFFAMISQGNTKVMENCGLLVIDELSMLSLEQRGPKLEMALEIVRARFPETRIMCLATCDCSTEKICNWLDISEPIVSTARPVGLEEHILRLDGKGSWRIIPKNHEILTEASAPEELQEEIKISGYRQDERPDEKAKKLLLAVIKNLYEKTPDARVLVFASTQSKAASLADFLKDNLHLWSPHGLPAPDEEFLSELKYCDRDEGQEHLIDALLPSGIAYHHAGLSSSLRELIEEQFRRPESCLRVIVATETLTVGVNMPFDAMIMTSNRVPRGHGELSPLSAQEYRNYIGRAGRLGQSNRTGQTYLFVENTGEFETYWNSYFVREEIKTALSKASELTLAPYYLSLVNNKIGSTDPNALRRGTEYSLKELDALFERSLAKACGAKNFRANELQQKLYDSYLSDKTIGSGFMARDAVKEECYAIPIFGNHMAPYAFSVDTCLKIYFLFYEGYKNGGLKLGVTQEDITSDRYLLDILYHVCCHEEVANSSSIPYPQLDRNPTRTFQARAKVVEQLREILSETDENGKLKYSLFCDGLDEEICNRSGLYLLKGTHNISDEFDKLQATLRAIVLFYWTKGYSIEELKKKTGFHQFTKIIAGDIERLAEMVAFHLDAIQRCLTTANDPISGKSVLENAAAVRAFYELHTRVKYGMPRELAKFANKHVHGLDRKRLLKLKQCADEAKLSPIQYLCITPSGRIPTDVLTATQHTQLLMAMERRGNVRHIDTLMEIIQNDLATDLNDEQFDSLKEIANWGDLTQSDRVDAETLFTNLRNVIENNSAFESVDFSTDGDYNRILWTIRDLKTNKRRRVYFGILAEDETDESLVSFFEKADNDLNAYAKILVAPYKFSTEQVDRAMKAHKVHTLIDNMYLTFVLSNTIRMHIDEGHALTEMLADLRGSFTAADYRYFPLLNFLYREKDNTVPRYRILFGGGNSLRADGGFNAQESARNLTARENFGPCEILPWGDQLVDDTYNFAECPTIISLTRKDVTRSESLTRFIYKMQNQHFRHCLLLLDSEEAEIAWNSPEVMEEYGNTQWSPQFNSITKDIVYDERSAQTRIRNFVDTWRPGKYLVGISYAHYTSVQGDPSSELKTDCDRIFELAEALKKEFGEDRIFFDRFSPAKEVFEENRNAEKSIKAYETCLANIILWNYWTKNNENCIREREAILKRSASDEAYCMFVKTGNPTDPESYENYFPLLLRNESDIEKIVSRIKQEVEARLNNE